MRPYTPLLCLIACSLAIPAAAQARADTPTHTACRNVGVTVTCQNVTPVSATDALTIFTTSSALDVEEPPPFVPPEGSTYIGRIYGDVFSDQWPFESAGIYSRLFGDCGARCHRVRSPRLYSGVHAFDPLTGRWSR